MKVLLEYPGRHHYMQEYTKTDLFCPTCGKQEVWQENSGGDYYLGAEYKCTACGSNARLDMVYGPRNEEPDLGILDQLRNGYTKTPTTPRGN